MKCYKCGKQLEEGDKFCLSCGANQLEPESEFCAGCGEKLLPGAAFCPKCGTKNGVSATSQPQNHMQNPNTGVMAGDARSGGYAVLCGFFPVVGLILFLVWMQTMPLRAKSCGKGAIIGVCVYFGVIILFWILGIFLIMSIGTSLVGPYLSFIPTIYR